MSQTDGTRRILRLGGGKNLEHIGPIKMYVCIQTLRVVISSWINDEPIVGMNVSEPEASVY